MMNPTAALRAVKLLHTVVWAFFAASIVAIPVFAWRGDWVVTAGLIALVFVEVGVLAANHWRCPLTAIAARYTAERQDNFDIYLPLWLARFNKVIFGSLFGIGLLASAFAALLYFGGTWRLHQIPKVPAAVRVPALGDPVQGERLAAVIGCSACHGKGLGGDPDCYSEPGRFHFVCPNITEVRERYSDTELVTLLRHGRKRDGAIVDFMPWDMYAHLTDADLGDVLAFVRSTPKIVKPPMPASDYSWSIRWQMLRGTYPPQNSMSDYDSKALEGPAERGRYLASVACTECHAPDLRGYPGDTAPSLAVAKAYTPEAFARLMHDGITIAGTTSATGLMTGVARARFAHLLPDEVTALKTYLDQRAP